MKPLADGVRVAYPLFQGEGGGSTPTSALQLFFRTVALGVARDLNALWHSRLPAFTSPQCRIAYAAEFDELFYGVAIWVRPIARALPQYTWMELSRLAISPDAPRNTASRMLGWMARDVGRRYPEIERLISYQDTEVHTGGIYRAAGWIPVDAPSGGRHWSSAGRQRNTDRIANKVRWEKQLWKPPIALLIQMSRKEPERWEDQERADTSLEALQKEFDARLPTSPPEPKDDAPAAILVPR